MIKEEDKENSFIVDWKASAGEVMEEVEKILEKFGLKVIEIDTMADSFCYRIEKK